MKKRLIKGLVVGGMLCCMTMFTACSSLDSIRNTLGLLMGTQAQQESGETDVNKHAYIVDETVQKPEITKNLGGEAIVYASNASAAALTVEAQVSDGGTLSYQWYRNNVDANGGGSVLEGATSSSYTPATTEVGTVFYYVVVTNNIDDRIQMVTSTTQKVTVEAQTLVPEEVPTDTPAE